MGNTLKKMDRDSAGGKTLSQEELKMKKDKQLYEGAATDLAAQLNTGKFRRQAAEDNKDNIDLFQDPDSFRRQYEAMEDLREDEEEGWQKKKGLALQMAELDRLMAQSEQAFNSREATHARPAPPRRPCPPCHGPALPCPSFHPLLCALLRGEALPWGARGEECPTAAETARHTMSALSLSLSLCVWVCLWTV